LSRSLSGRIDVSDTESDRAADDVADWAAQHQIRNKIVSRQ
jgi:hypothetical protein